MKKFLFALILLLVCASAAQAATIYIDGSMGADCTTGNYSIANRNCTGSNGNAYNDIQAALTASAANDTIEFRTGSYTSNASSSFAIFPKAGQTWQARSGEAVTISDTTHWRIFQIESVNNVIIRDLTLIGAQQNAIWIGSTTGSKIINNNISGWNRDGVSYYHGISYAAATVNVEITGNTVHDPFAFATEVAGIGGGFSASNLLIDGNTIYGTGSGSQRLDMGIWSDVESCAPNVGLIPCIVRNNIVHDIETYCYHIELGSVWNMYKNIGYNCKAYAVFVRPGDRGSNGINIRNNTFWNVGSRNFGGTGGGIMFIADVSTSFRVINTNVENNIIASSVNLGDLLSIGVGSSSETTNRFRNNLIFAQNNNFGICWNKQLGSGTACGTGTSYADTTAGISSWQSVAPGGVASGNIAGDPLFANPAGGDFRLCTAAGVPHASCTGRSPAIDAGINVGLAFQGPAPDIGALEAAAPSAPGLYADGGTLGGCTNGNKTYNPATRTCGSGTDTVYVGTTTTVTLANPVGTPPLVYLGPPIAGTYTRNTALQLAINASAGGDTIYVRQFGPSSNLGVYWGTNSALQNFIVPKAGLSVSQRSTIEGYGSERPIIQGISAPDDNGVSFILIRNLIIDGASAPNMSNTVVGVLDSRFENSIIRNSGGHGLWGIYRTDFINVTSHTHGYRAHLTTPGCLGNGESPPAPACFCGLNDHTCHNIYAGDHITIDGGDWYNATGYGIHCNPQCSGSIIKNVRIHHHGAHGMILGCCSGTLPPGFVYEPNIVSNVVADHNGLNPAGAVVTPGAHGVWIPSSNSVGYNITATANTGFGVCLSQSGGLILRNTIALGNVDGPIDSTGMSCHGVAATTPILSNNITTGSTSVFANYAGLPAIGCDYACAVKYLGLNLSPPPPTSTTIDRGVASIRTTPAISIPACPTGAPNCYTGTAPDIGAYEVGAVVPGNQPPVVMISTNGGNPISTPNATAQTLTAACTDDVACVSATWTSNRYGAGGPCSGTTTLTCVTGTLPVGESIITITAVDGSLASGTDTIAITYALSHPGDSIVLAMGFSENTGTTTADSSGNNNNGTLAGGATWTSSGKYGSGIRFDGTSGSVNVSGTLNNSLNLTQGLTIEAWVFPETGGSSYQVILQKNGAGSILSAPYFLIGVSGICGSNVPDGGIIVNDDGTPRNACAGPPLTPNIWTHLAVTYNRSVITLYRDGVSVATLAETGLMVPTAGSLTIGRAGSDGFRGVLDEIRIANYARSEAQIKADMIEPVTAPVPPTAVKVSSGSTRKFASGTVQKMTQ